jgi:catechol 2,3-dioxygenase-like lactoylglutathione lyase family enzyme
MTNSSFYHLQVNVDFKNSAFYKGLMEFLGWETMFEGEDMSGFKSKQDVDLWFVDAEKNITQDYDAKGVNHIGIRVEKQENVDQLVEFLASQNVPALFETPRHRPEFVAIETDTYYQVMFESPDRVLFEVVYKGPKQ